MSRCRANPRPLRFSRRQPNSLPVTCYDASSMASERLGLASSALFVCVTLLACDWHVASLCRRRGARSLHAGANRSPTAAAPASFAPRPGDRARDRLLSRRSGRRSYSRRAIDVGRSGDRRVRGRDRSSDRQWQLRTRGAGCRSESLGAGRRRRLRSAGARFRFARRPSRR